MLEKTLGWIRENRMEENLNQNLTPTEVMRGWVPFLQRSHCGTQFKVVQYIEKCNTKHLV